MSLSKILQLNPIVYMFYKKGREEINQLSPCINLQDCY